MTSNATPLERLVEVLKAAGQHPTAEDIADVVWLASRLPSRQASAPPLPAPSVAAPPPIAPSTPRQSAPPSQAETFGHAGTVTSTTAAARASAGLYPAQAGASSGGGPAARTIRSPGALALPGTLELGRSLRPMKRRVPSPSHLVLDEAATAQRIADTGDWMPVFRPAPERWLDIVLVVEESSSMIIWQRTLVELQRLLERQGAFRRIHVLGFRAAADQRSIHLYTGTGPRADGRRARRAAELIDPRGRRMIAIVSDCVSPVWHNGAVATLLHMWGRPGMTAIVQLLPHHLWVRTGLRTFPRVFVRSPAPGAANSTFDVEFTGYRPRSGLGRGVAVPVVSLESESLEHWARAVAGNSNLWIPGALAIPATPVPPTASAAREAAARQSEAVSVDQIVRVFYGTASPTARRLANILAAVPLTLPVIRLVQRALLPESRQVHLAEVWLSGLIERTASADRSTPAENVEYFFVNGARERLVANLGLGEVIDVLNTVSAYVGERVGQPLDFNALIADPTATGDVQIAQGYQSFARVAAGALRQFGGYYAQLANRLEVSLYGESLRQLDAVTELRVEMPAVPASADVAPTKQNVRVEALLVGVDEHQSIEIPRLRGAGHDARLTQKWLHDRFGLATDNIITLLDRQATRSAIIAAWRACVSRLEPGDQFFFHFSGNDVQIASDDPHEADGLEETLLTYDSVPSDRSTLLTHQDLANLAAEVESRGARAILFLDSCRTASGLFARRALPNTLVFAAAAEMELAYEVVNGDQHSGIASTSLAEAMQAYRPGMTWLDVYDHVLARVKAGGHPQTPQLIGAGDLTIFGNERRPVAPYLVVTKANEHEIEVHAAAALFPVIDDAARLLAIYEPGGSTSGTPIAFARVMRRTDDGVAARLESAPVVVSPGSRVRLVDDATAQQVLTVAIGDDLRDSKTDRLPFAIVPPASDDYDLIASLSDETLALHDRDGWEVWREDLGETADPATPAERLRSVLEHLCGWLRTAALDNVHAEPDLAGKIELELLIPEPAETIALAESQPLTLRLTNHSVENVYVSVWMLDEFLRVERIYPPTTSCVLLGKERDVTLAVAVRPNRAIDRPTRLTFKAFASRAPADLALFALPPIAGAMQLQNLLGRSRQPAASREAGATTTAQRREAARNEVPKGGPIVTGGPVAVTAKLWQHGMRLRVKFLNGAPPLQQRVMKIAREWTAHTNLQFDVVAKGDAELRVAFGEPSPWSYLGTDSVNVPSGQPTINLGLLTHTTPVREMRRTVLYTFGHALGLASAHLSPVAAIPWDKKAAYDYYGKQGWDKSTVDRNLFKKFEPNQVAFGPADPESIMSIPIPAEVIKGHVHAKTSDKLSAIDQRFIAQLYPVWRAPARKRK